MPEAESEASVVCSDTPSATVADRCAVLVVSDSVCSCTESASAVSGPDSEQTYVLDFPGHENGVAGLLGTLRESPLVLSAAAVGE